MSYSEWYKAFSSYSEIPTKEYLSNLRHKRYGGEKTALERITQIKEIVSSIKRENMKTRLFQGSLTKL
jgi:hypothetical protein